MMRSTIHSLILSLLLVSLFATLASASSPDAGLIAGVEAPPTAGAAVDRAINEGVDGDTMAMIVGLVLAVGMALRTGLPVLRKNRIVGWGLNVGLTAGGVVFVYLAEDLRLDLSVLLDIVKGSLLAAGGWNAVKAAAPGATKTASAPS